MTDNPNLHKRGVILVLVGAVLWSTGGLLLRLIDVDELTTIFWRAVFAFAALSTYLLWTEGRRLIAVFRQFGWPQLIVAACFATDATLFVFAINRTSVANVMIIFGLSPFVAALLAWAVLGEGIPRMTWAAMSACAVGVIIMMSGSVGGHSLVGDAIALVIIVVFAIGVVTIRMHPDIEMIPVVCLSALLMGVISFPFATAFGHSPTDYALLAVFGALEYALALVAFTIGASYIPAAQSTLMALLENVLAPVWVWLVVNEIPGQPTIAGGVLILITLILHTVYTMKDESVQPD